MRNFLTLAILVVNVYLAAGQRNFNFEFAPPPPKPSYRITVMVLGGNGFLGNYVTVELLKIGADVMIVNRGNSYWDNDRYISGYAANQTCDRDGHPRACTHFYSYASVLGRLDLVIDLTAWKRAHVMSMTELLGSKPRLYVYISSSLIYELSPVEKPNGVGYREEDAGRHSDPNLSNDRISLNVYANGKLEGEDGYHHAHIVRRANVLVLRVAQLFGPRESLVRYPLRWMTWQLWIALAGRQESNVSLTFPGWLETHQFDLAYVRDVARLVEQLRHSVDFGPSPSATQKPPVPGRRAEPVLNMNQPSFTVLNVAYPEKFTVRKLVLAIAEALRTNVSLVESRIRFVPESETPKSAVELTFPSHFPATRFGVMDTEKLYSHLPTFRPTDFQTAVRETVDYYNEAFATGRYEKQIQIAVERLIRLGITTNETVASYFEDVRRLRLEKLAEQLAIWEREQLNRPKDRSEL